MIFINMQCNFIISKNITNPKINSFVNNKFYL